MFNDTYLSSIRSTRVNTCAQIWMNDIKWIRIDPISTKIHAHHSSKKLLNNDGVHSKILLDGTREKIMGKFKEACKYTTVQVQKLEYNNTWTNRAEGTV